MQALFRFFETLATFTFSFLQMVFFIPSIHTEVYVEGELKGTHRVMVFKGDWLFNLAVAMPAILGLLSVCIVVLECAAMAFQLSLAPWYTLVFIFIAYLCYRWLSYVYDKRGALLMEVPPDSRVVRTFWFWVTYHSQGYLFKIPGFTKEVLLIGSQDPLRTPDINDKDVITASMQVTRTIVLDGEEHERLELGRVKFQFLVVLKPNFRRMKQMIDTYYFEFSQSRTGSLQAILEPQFQQVISGVAKTKLTNQKLDEVQRDRAGKARELLEAFRARICELYPIEVQGLDILHIKAKYIDVQERESDARLEAQAVEVEQQSKAKQAEDTQTSRQRQEIASQNADIAIYQRKAEAFRELLVTAKLQARIDNAPLIKRLRILRGNQALAFVEVLTRMTPSQALEGLKAFADALNVDFGDNNTLAGIGDGLKPFSIPAILADITQRYLKDPAAASAEKLGAAS